MTRTVLGGVLRQSSTRNGTSGMREQGRWEAWLSQEWVLEYKSWAADLARQQVPMLLALAEEHTMSFADAHNLTQVCAQSHHVRHTVISC